MALFDTLRRALAVPYQAASVAQHTIASPYDRPNHLLPIAWPEFPTAGRVTRAEAMGVPAVARARLLLCNTIARMSMRSYTGSVLDDPQPLWLDRTDGPLSPYHRMLWTVDDLLFHGWSLWALNRDRDGAVVAADRVPFDLWEFDDDGHITYENRPVDETTVALIPGSHEGILSYGRHAIRHAADLIAAAGKAAATPSAYLELHQTNDAPMTDDQIRGLVSDWQRARRGENGGVAYTSNAIEIREHGAPSEHLLVEGRNAAAVDVARIIGIPAALVDATTPTASLNYENREGRTRELVELTLSAYMSPVTARLGLDDVARRGHRIAFDLEEYVADTDLIGTPDEDAGLRDRRLDDDDPSIDPSRTSLVKERS